jgi:hypothetical protein
MSTEFQNAIAAKIKDRLEFIYNRNEREMAEVHRLINKGKYHSTVDWSSKMQVPPPGGRVSDSFRAQFTGMIRGRKELEAATHILNNLDNFPEINSLINRIAEQDVEVQMIDMKYRQGITMTPEQLKESRERSYKDIVEGLQFIDERTRESSRETNFTDFQ